MSETPTVRVAGNVRAEMARLGVRQREVADLLGLSQAAVSKRLIGHVPWDINELTTVARFLGVPVSVLITEPVTGATA